MNLECFFLSSTNKNYFGCSQQMDKFIWGPFTFTEFLNFQIDVTSLYYILRWNAVLFLHYIYLIVTVTKDVLCIIAAFT